jgi:hypothetical protein
LWLRLRLRLRLRLCCSKMRMAIVCQEESYTAWAGRLLASSAGSLFEPGQAGALLL